MKQGRLRHDLLDGAGGRLLRLARFHPPPDGPGPDLCRRTALCRGIVRNLPPPFHPANSPKRQDTYHRRSPRWLIEKGRVTQATSALHYLREGSFTHTEVESEVDAMISAVDSQSASGPTWKSLFREGPLFARLWRAALLHFMAQMCGAAAMKYYLPTLLEALGIGTRLALMAGAIEVTLKIGCSVVEVLIVDRLGRTLTLGIGCVAMATGMLVGGPLYLAPFTLSSYRFLPANSDTFDPFGCRRPRFCLKRTNDVCRSTGPCHYCTRKTLVWRPTWCASPSSSYTRSATAWVSARPLGCMARK